MKPKVVDREHADCGGAMVSKLPKVTWPKGAFVETMKIWQQEWFYITKPHGANWEDTPEFRSRAVGVMDQQGSRLGVDR